MVRKLDQPKSFPCSHGQTIQCAICGFYTYDYPGVENVNQKHLNQSHMALAEFRWATRLTKMERRLKRHNRKTERAAARAGRKLRRMPYAKAVKKEFGEKKWSRRAIFRRFGYVPLADYEYAKGQLQTLTHNYTVPPAPMGYQLDAETLTTIAKDAVYELGRRERGK